MKFKATAYGTWPPGVHWTPDEVRDLPDTLKGVKNTPPGWIIAVKQKRTKPAPTSEGDDAPTEG